MQEITAIFGTIPDFIVDQWIKDMLDDQEWDQNTVLQVISDQTKTPLPSRKPLNPFLRTGMKRPRC